MKKLITLPLLISMTGLLFANQSLAITQSQMQMRATATCDSYASMSRCTGLYSLPALAHTSVGKQKSRHKLYCYNLLMML